MVGHGFLYDVNVCMHIFIESTRLGLLCLTKYSNIVLLVYLFKIVLVCLHFKTAAVD